MLHFFEFCLALGNDLLILHRVLLALMLVHLCRPDNLSLEMSHNVFFDGQLNHLRSLAYRALPYRVGPANFKELSATVATTRDHSELTL